MAFKDKVERADELATTLSESKGTVVVDYRGLNVADIGALRRRLRDQGVELRVAKNTLLRRAAAACNIVNVDTLFTGPTAIASSAEDEVAAARMMAEAARVPRTPLQIKGGIYGLRGVSLDQVRAIAELPGRDVMLARAVGTAQAPAAAALSVIQALPRQVLNAVTALQTQRETAESPSA
jgi:large subunit ribosomal protein L10